MITEYAQVISDVIANAWFDALNAEGLAVSIRERDVVDDAIGKVVEKFAALFEALPGDVFDRDVFVRSASVAATRAEKRGP